MFLPYRESVNSFQRKFVDQQYILQRYWDCLDVLVGAITIERLSPGVTVPENGNVIQSRLVPRPGVNLVRNHVCTNRLLVHRPPPPTNSFVPIVRPTPVRPVCVISPVHSTSPIHVNSPINVTSPIPGPSIENPSYDSPLSPPNIPLSPNMPPVYEEIVVCPTITFANYE